MVSPAVEPSIGNKKLDPTVFFGLHEFSGQLGERVRACESGSAAAGIHSLTLTLSHSLTQFLQQPATLLVIHRTSVVRIDQAEIPQLGSLVEVRDAGSGDFQQGLRQGIEQAVMADLCLKLTKVPQETPAVLLVEDVRDELTNGVIVGGVRVDPAAVNLGLLNRLFHVLANAVDEVPTPLVPKLQFGNEG